MKQGTLVNRIMMLVLLAAVVLCLAVSAWRSFRNPYTLVPCYAYTVDDTLEIGVQINGKVKATVWIGAQDTKEQIQEKAMAEPKVAAALSGMQVVKVIVIPGRIVNIVVKPV